MLPLQGPQAASSLSNSISTCPKRVEQRSIASSTSNIQKTLGPQVPGRAETPIGLSETGLSTRREASTTFSTASPRSLFHHFLRPTLQAVHRGRCLVIFRLAFIPPSKNHRCT